MFCFFGFFFAVVPRGEFIFLSFHLDYVLEQSIQQLESIFIFVGIFPLATVKALVVFSSVLFYLCRSEREKENFRITVSCQYFGCSSCILHVDVDMGDLFHSAFLPAHFHPSLGRTRV